MDLEIRILSELEDENTNNNYLYSAIEKDKRCIEFLNRFTLFYGKEINNKKNAMKRIEDELFELLEKIKKTGIDISNNARNYKEYSIGIGVGFVYFKNALFNGLSFDEENLEYLRKVIKCNILPLDEPFETSYNEWCAEYGEAEKEYDELINRLQQISKQKIRTALFVDKKEMESLDNRRNVLNYILMDGRAKKIRAERFKKLSYEQLKLIYEYYELVKELESKSTGNLEMIGIQLSYPVSLNKDEVKKVLDNMLKNNTYMQEEFLHVKLVILKNYLRHQFDEDDFCRANLDYDDKLLINNFIITVSNEINELYLEFVSNLDKIESFQKKK